MKHTVITFIILFLGLGGNPIQAQDLIHRARHNIPAVNSRAGASVAFQESQSLKHTGPYQVVKPFDLAPKLRSTYIDEVVEDYIMLQLPDGTLPRLLTSLRNGVELHIPVTSTSSIKLELIEVSPIHSEFEGRTSAGETFTTVDFPVRCYRGSIKGDHNSYATVTIANDMFRILMGDDFGNYVLAELNGKSNEFVLYNDKRLKIKHEFECGTEDPPLTKVENQMLFSDNKTIRTIRSSNCTDILVEMEKHMYDKWNNLNSAVNFIYALMNEAATIYNNDNISITLKQVIIWTTADPYDKLDACDQVYQYGDYRKNNYNARLAHLISSRTLGGGCAFIDELCSNYSSVGDRGPYQFSGSLSTSTTSFPTYSWNVMVFVHEMGHTFGSRHTHSCVWNGDSTAIDGCVSTTGSCPRPAVPTNGGTLMSYCHQQSVGINFNLGFGPQPGALIRNKIQSASCSLDCGNSSNCPRYIYLDGLVQNDTYYADIGIEIGGYIPSTGDVHLRFENNVILNPGFIVFQGGFLTMDYATCNAAFSSDKSGNRQITPLSEKNSINYSIYNK